jgi:hypothetical protein
MHALKKPDFDRLSTAQGHYDLLHAEPRGVSIVWERLGGRQWHKLQPNSPLVPHILAGQNAGTDRYLSVNEFFAWRIVNQLKSLRALYVDLDDKLSGTSLTLPDVLDALHDAKLPKPSFVMQTGRGMHLYWLHEPLPAQVLPVWQRCQDTINKALATAGADAAAKDCARVLRLAGSVNSKTSTVVHGLVLDAEPYNFHHLCDEILGERKPKPERTVLDLSTAKAHRGQRVRTGSIYDWWHLVYRDLLSIARYYDFGGVPHGHRDQWLFLSAVALSWFARPETLQRELEGQARVWTPDLSVKEVRNAISPPLERARKAADGLTQEWEGEVRDARYWFKRETLYARLQAIIPADLELELRAIVSDDVRAKHKRETDAKHQEKRYATHHADSAAQQQPWVALGISRRTYYRKKAQGSL